jgi:hypothetical protein
VVCFTAAAVANIDAEGDPQYWGYTTDTSLAAKDHTLGTCPQDDNLKVEVVGPCDTVSGQSVF